MKKILQEGKKTRQKRAEAEASKEDEATVLTAVQASASASEGINDKAESICWFCHADVTSIRNNRCAGCKKVSLYFVLSHDE